MSDWLEKLSDEYRSKRKEENDEAQRRFAHDQFIGGHGQRFWLDLEPKIDEACKRLGSPYTLMRNVDGGGGFVIAGGNKPLDVTMDPKTKVISWSLRDTQNRGKLRADRHNDELVYKDSDDGILHLDDVAAFLMRKTF